MVEYRSDDNNDQEYHKEGNSDQVLEKVHFSKTYVCGFDLPARALVLGFFVTE